MSEPAKDISKHMTNWSRRPSNRDRGNLPIVDTYKEFDPSKLSKALRASDMTTATKLALRSFHSSTDTSERIANSLYETNLTRNSNQSPDGRVISHGTNSQEDSYARGRLHRDSQHKTAILYLIDEIMTMLPTTEREVQSVTAYLAYLLVSKELSSDLELGDLDRWPDLKESVTLLELSLGDSKNEEFYDPRRKNSLFMTKAREVLNVSRSIMLNGKDIISTRIQSIMGITQDDLDHSDDGHIDVYSRTDYRVEEDTGADY